MPHVTVGYGPKGNPTCQVGGRPFVFFRNPRPDAIDPASGERYDDVRLALWGHDERRRVLADCCGGRRRLDSFLRSRRQASRPPTLGRPGDRGRARPARRSPTRGLPLGGRRLSTRSDRGRAAPHRGDAL
ncbi:MAG: hypothetical protein ACRDHY_09270 [Anaerolineales bacterium]